MNYKDIRKNLKEKLKLIRIYFAEQNDLILTSNLQIYERLSVFSFITVFLYNLTTRILLQEWRTSPFLLLMLVLLSVHIVVAHYINKHRLKSKTMEKVVCVLFSLCLFLILVCTDTVAAPNSSQIFCSAFLVIAPSIFITNVSRVIIDQLFFVAVYGCFAFGFKEQSFATNDMYAIWAGFFFGIILYAITMDLRLQVNAEVIRLKYFSEIDELTKITNRREANAQIAFLLEQREKDTPCALMLLDVDFFKTINDTYGHQVGDEVLVAVARVLKNSFRQTDVVSRFGGDEFLIFVSGFKQEDFPGKKCQDIQSGVRNIMKDKLKVSCSIGVCMLMNGHRTMDELVSEADKALYETKEREKGTYTVSVIH